VYRMPKKRRKTAMRYLHFEVPLIRLVMPLDSPDGKLPTSSMKASSTPHLQTLLRLARIETPFDDLLTAKAPRSEPRLGADKRPVQAKPKKSIRMPKAAGAGDRRASSQPKKK
jgi:hypothetical protein